MSVEVDGFEPVLLELYRNIEISACDMYIFMRCVIRVLL